MKAQNYKSKTHRVHTDILPILSAIKHGKKRIAQERYHSLCERMKLVRWECVALIDIIRAKQKELGI